MRYIQSTLFRGPALVLCLALALSGCASATGKSYTKDEARQVQTVQRGVILSIEEVTIEEDPSGAGTILGGAAGGVIGSTMGAKSGRVLATLGGAIIGGVLGTVGEKALRNQKAYEFMIDLDTGGTISIVQAVDDTPFRVGSQVRVLRSGNNRARVVLAQ